MDRNPNSSRPLQPHVQNPQFRSPIQYGMMPSPQYYPSPRTPTSPIPHPFPTSPLPLDFYQRTPPPVIDKASIRTDTAAMAIGPPPQLQRQNSNNTATQRSRQNQSGFQQQQVNHLLPHAFQEHPGEPSILVELQQKLEHREETFDPKQVVIIANELMMLWQTRIQGRPNRKPSGKSSERSKNSSVESYHMEHKAIPHLELEEYPNRRKGLVLIVNNQTFETKNERKGSDKDVVTATKFFTSIGYSVVQKENRTAAEMRLDLDEFLSDPGQKNADCCFFIFLSHGCKSKKGTSLYGSDGNLVEIRNLLSSAQLCQSLKDKPKCFLIQACRGDKVLDVSFDSESLAIGDKVANGNEGDSDGEYDPLDFKAKKPVEPYLKDTFIWYSTTPGCKSYRLRDCKGSVFIQSVFKTLTEHHKKETLQVLRSHVNRVVCEVRSAKGKVQIPNGRDYLTKKFFV